MLDKQWEIKLLKYKNKQMNLSDITLKNIKSYIEGNIITIANQLELASPHIKEQILFRSYMCRDCYKEGHAIKGPKHCKECGCALPGKWGSTRSCNEGKRFPDLMNRQDWEKYKQTIDWQTINNDISLL